MDSTLASIGYGMLCVWAADLRDAGATPEVCVEHLNSHKIFINTYYTTDDLKYLYHSGRVSRAGAIVGTALKINPILNLDQEGHLIVREKVRGRHKARHRIYDIVQELVDDPGSQTAISVIPIAKLKRWNRFPRPSSAGSAFKAPSSSIISAPP